MALVLGRDDIRHDVVMSGKTDPQIALEILAAVGVSADAAPRHVPAVIDQLEAALGAAVDELRSGGRVLPGVPELLSRFHDEEHVLQSVLTGNTRSNAAVKLAAFGLDQWIDVDAGAYGSDHAERRRLVPIALQRASAQRGRVFAASEVWVIGDTPNDLACAQAAAARCILVATGRIPIGELRGLGADAVLDDLSDVDEVVRLVLS